MSVKIDFGDMNIMDAKFRRMKTLFRDFRPAWEDFFRWYVKHVKRQFDTGGEGQWAPLADKTQTARAKRRGYYKRGSSEGPARRIGVWTQEMVKNLATSKSNRYVKITRTKKKFGLRIDYPKFDGFETGKGGRSSGRPRRLVLRKAMLISRIKDAVNDHIRDAFK